VTDTQPYPGARLGLPEEGRGSVATFPRRLVAILIDWVLCTVIAYAVFGLEWGMTGADASFLPLAVFAVENVLLVSTLGTTIGHRLLGLQVLRLSEAGSGGRRVAGVPGPWRGTVRTALLCLAVPALVWDADSRGLHDKAAGTVIVRAR
jgi:uncharacterized RDD family membrane protein YckC